MNGPITIKEVSEAIKMIKMKQERMDYQLLIITVLRSTFTTSNTMISILQAGNMPDSWKEADIASIPKEGPRFDFNKKLFTQLMEEEKIIIDF